MRAAAIDMGTNTFHLVIADLSEGNINVIEKVNIPVKLGEGRLNDNIIIPEALERGLQALTGFSALIDKHGVSIVKATATSAVRSASNGADFVQMALQRSGIVVEVLDGDQEATYIYKGVKATGVISNTSLIMDIGGGSTEFIMATPSQCLWKKSYNIGAARLMQAYFHSDPISENDKSQISHHISQQLLDLKEACLQFQPEILIGSAGAFETFAGMLNPQLDIKSVAMAEINLNDYQSLASLLISSTHQDRMNMEGLIPLRVDMIVMAAILTNYVIGELHPRGFFLSTYDLKMGVLQSIAEQAFPC